MLFSAFSGKESDSPKLITSFPFVIFILCALSEDPKEDNNNPCETFQVSASVKEAAVGDPGVRGSRQVSMNLTHPLDQF